MADVGGIYIVRFPYYDMVTSRIKFKSRPCMIIKEENGKIPNDVTVLPVSKITDKSRINALYDIEVKSIDYPLLNLTEAVSYIRTHKAYTVNSKDLTKKICSNLNSIYPLLYVNIRNLVENYFSNVL